MNDTLITAGIVIIGDEILSGRTKDSNIGTLADYLTDLGIDLREVRVVSDRTEAIVAAVNALRATYDEVFTTGGIGPTHDDITAESIAAAFGVELYEDPAALEMMRARYGETALSESRRRMARVPQGASLIANGATAAPGFTIGNVHVLAGVPEIMKAMLIELTPTLRRGVKLLSKTIAVAAPEGAFAADLAALQRKHPEVAIGSYPQMSPAGFSTEIVIRSRDAARLEEAVREAEAMLSAIAATADPNSNDAP